MEVQYASYSYWRMVKKGWFLFSDIVTDDMKNQVRYLAKLEVAAGTITADKYKELIGEDYTPIVETEE